MRHTLHRGRAEDGNGDDPDAVPGELRVMLLEDLRAPRDFGAGVLGETEDSLEGEQGKSPSAGQLGDFVEVDHHLDVVLVRLQGAHRWDHRTPRATVVRATGSTWTIGLPAA